MAVVGASSVPVLAGTTRVRASLRLRAAGLALRRHGRGARHAGARAMAPEAFEARVDAGALVGFASVVGMTALVQGKAAAANKFRDAAAAKREALRALDLRRLNESLDDDEYESLRREVDALEAQEDDAAVLFTVGGTKVRIRTPGADGLPRRARRAGEAGGREEADGDREVSTPQWRVNLLIGASGLLTVVLLFLFALLVTVDPAGV